MKKLNSIVLIFSIGLISLFMAAVIVECKRSSSFKQQHMYNHKMIYVSKGIYDCIDCDTCSICKKLNN